MQRGDDPDRTRRAAPGEWRTGNHHPGGTRRPGDDPTTRRHAPPPPGPPPPGATRRMGGRPPGPPPGADGTRRMGPGDQSTRHLGPPPTAAYGAADRAPRPDATRMMPAPVTEPELLGGRYQLEGLLGQGGMADVHRATDTRLRRPVAVKIFGAADDPTADQRFEQEAQVMANLRHPGLVAVHDFAVEADRAYLVMELVEGPSLKDVILREDLPPEDIRRIGTEVAQTLAYVHSEGVTHRDVKPSNILIDADGRARLADFGIASLLGAEGHTGAGEILGTPAYLSPEQVRGREIGPKTDVYSLGLVLLEAWTGRQEYQGEGLQGAAERVNRPPVVPQDVPEPLQRTIAESTATEPRRRPDAGQVAEMLSEPAAGGAEPLPVEPDVERERPAQQHSGNGKWIALGALIVVLLVVIIGLLLFGGNRSGTETTPTTETSAPPTTTEKTTTGGGGFPIPGLPSNIPGIPTELPNLPSNLPNIPSELPNLPSNLPNPGQVGDDARGFWSQFQRWWEHFGGRDEN